MTSRHFALFGGAAMLGMGIASLVFKNLSQDAEDAGLSPLRIESSYGKFLGIFPLNVFNKSALLAFGLSGILSAALEEQGRPLARYYSQAVGLAMIPLAVLGSIKKTETLFGYWPLYGAEVMTHGAFGVVGGYFGFFAGAEKKTVTARKYPESSGYWISNRVA